MAESARDHILRTLAAAPGGEMPARPELPPFREQSMNRAELLGRFTENLVEQTGTVHHVEDAREVRQRLTEIVRVAGWKRVMVSEDDVLKTLALDTWSRDLGLTVLRPSQYKDRKAFKEAAFLKAEAGITGADFAVAESGTLVLVHDRRQPRLVSLAPVCHVAVVPVERLVGVYEQVIESVFAHGKRPDHLSWITGPSMTADIQATPFKGMHGPKHLTVIFLGKV